MNKDIFFPEQLTSEELDDYLLRGWYRMGQTIFSTNYIIQEGLLYRVYWLRYNISQLQFGSTQQKLINYNRKFDVSINKLKVTDELEALYTMYKSSIFFDAPDTVNHFLYDGGVFDIYDTDLIEIRDNGLLIAAGIYDKGKDSIAGIMNFYHPDYKKYSLGKYLMLLKITHAKSMGKTWYYPGYIVEGYPKFDYKLFIDKTRAEIYLPEFNSWVLYEQTSAEEANADALNE